MYVYIYVCMCDEPKPKTLIRNRTERKCNAIR